MEKRQIHDRVFDINDEEQALLKALPGDGDDKSMYIKLLPLLALIPGVQNEPGDDRGPWKIRVPAAVYDAAKRRAEELKISILQVLVRAARAKLAEDAKRVATPPAPTPPRTGL